MRRCYRCGYNLDGLDRPLICPECGAALSDADIEHRMLRARFRARVANVLISVGAGLSVLISLLAPLTVFGAFFLLAGACLTSWALYRIMKRRRVDEALGKATLAGFGAALLVWVCVQAIAMIR